MHKKLLRGLQFFVCGVMVAFLFGVATPAEATESATGNIEGTNNNAYLTKVLSLKDGVQVKNGNLIDSYTFTFAGNGTVEEVGGQLVSGSGNVPQHATLEAGDKVPALGTSGKVTLTAAQVDVSDENNETHQIGADNNTYVYVIRQSLKSIVEAATFEKPGIYTYRVTETDVSKVASGSNVGMTRSQASYLMMVTVKHIEGEGNVPTNIDVLKEKDDEGNTDGSEVYPQNLQKVDPAYPKVNSSDPTLIDTESGVPSGITSLAPDNRGRNVYGFTFANEYVIGQAFNLKKEVTGDFGERDKAFEVSVTFKDSSAPNNSRYVYRVYSYESDTGTWTQGNLQAARFMSNETIITEQLKDRDYISIIGLQGFSKSNADKYDDTTQNDLVKENLDRAWLGDGVVPNTTYTVSEKAYKNYRAKIITFDAGNGDDPKNITSATLANNPTVVANPNQVNSAATTAELSTGSEPKTVIVLNTYDDASVSPTGIIINNLPYVLLIGIPVAVFAVMFVSRRRNNDAAA